MMDKKRADRTIRVLGNAAFERLGNTSVLVAGVGGVGGYAAEHLVRCGVGRLIIVDGDVVDISNCNRQIAALSSTVGKSKCEVLKARFLEINPDLEIEIVSRFIKTKTDIEQLLDRNVDYVIDAIDDVPAKIELISSCVERKIKLTSSMGAAGKFDAQAVKLADISKTSGCPLARAVRKKLRERGISRGVNCVFSEESSIPGPAGEKPGSLSYVVCAFGTLCAQSIIADVINSSSVSNQSAEE